MKKYEDKQLVLKLFTVIGAILYKQRKVSYFNTLLAKRAYIQVMEKYLDNLETFN